MPVTHICLAKRWKTEFLRVVIADVFEQCGGQAYQIRILDTWGSDDLRYRDIDSVRFLYQLGTLSLKTVDADSEPFEIRLGDCELSLQTIPLTPDSCEFFTLVIDGITRDFE